MNRCPSYESDLSALIDGDLSGARAADVRAHLDECARCRGIAADLERVRAAARSLGPMAPPSHVWLEIAGRIRLEQPPAPAGAGPTRRASTMSWIGLAAALVLVTLGVYAITSVSTPAPGEVVVLPPSGNPAAADAVETAVAELDRAAKHYGNALAELERLAAENVGELTATLAATLRAQLGVADAAIADSRRAMEIDPGSQPARDSLFDAFRRKVGVLQATVSLMNEMRQGNLEGTAAAATILNNKG